MKEVPPDEGVTLPETEAMKASHASTAADFADAPKVVPAQTQGCSACAAAAAASLATTPIPDPWVYVIGDVDPEFPSLSVEMEVNRAMDQVGTDNLSNDAALQKVLGDDRFSYLLREMCWILRIQEVESYLLVPRFPQDYPMLLEAAKTEMSVVVGSRGPISTPDMCNGLTLPILVFDKIFSFTPTELMAKMPLPANAEADTFRKQAMETFKQLVPLVGDGTGMKRALAHALVTNPDLFTTIDEGFKRGDQLTSVNIRPASLASPRKLVDLVVTTTNRARAITTTTKQTYDLSGKFPCAVGGFQPHYAP